MTLIKRWFICYLFLVNVTGKHNYVYSMQNYCLLVFKWQFNIRTNASMHFWNVWQHCIYFSHIGLFVNFLPWPFAPHIFTIAVLITACALGHMHDILTRTCSPLTFITTCCSEISLDGLAVLSFPLCFLPGYPHRSSIHSDFIRWMRKCFCVLEFSVWSLMGFGILWPPRHVLLHNKKGTFHLFPCLQAW